MIATLSPHTTSKASRALGVFVSPAHEELASLVLVIKGFRLQRYGVCSSLVSDIFALHGICRVFDLSCHFVSAAVSSVSSFQLEPLSQH